MDDLYAKSILERGKEEKNNIFKITGLANLFNFNSFYNGSSKARKSKPLPLPPTKSNHLAAQNNVNQEKLDHKTQMKADLLPPMQPALPVQEITTRSPTLGKKPFDIKRLCIPDDKSILDYSTFLSNIPVWKKFEETDAQGRKECFYYNSIINRRIRGCCADSKNIVTCCSLCDHDRWIFQGSEYDPGISLLYAQNDGCIPFEVKLKNPKFIIPWRYKNRRSGSVSWKIIHMCGENVEDAESETIAINISRDKRLRKILDKVCVEANKYEKAERVEYLLSVIKSALGDYGIEGGSTSSQADASLCLQMKKQGHNFMLLGNVKIGLCRHKALLFKILCDAVNIECALVTGYSTGGRHQWNVINLDQENYIIDPTSPHFTWTKSGSARLKAYKINAEQSFGHGGMTLLKNLASSPNV